MRDIITPFNNMQVGELHEIGGKGVNLAALTGAGFAVPEGFCISTDAYHTFLRETGADSRIASMLNDVDVSVLDELQAFGKAARELILEHNIPGSISQPILTAYCKLFTLTPSAVELTPRPPLLEREGEKKRILPALLPPLSSQERGPGGEFFAAHPPYAGDNSKLYVAVRSSATAEDLPGLSFAGQHDTYLNIFGGSNLLQAVKQCWASLWSDRVIAYRYKHGVEHTRALMAVIVQRMIPAEVSGVLFTANPVNNTHNECLINANWGLGESVVSGEVMPDEFVVGKAGLTIKQAHIAEKTAMVAFGQTGTQTMPVPTEQRKRSCLTNHQLRKLAAVGKLIEDHFGAPQDIEWSIVGKRLYILQSRPITTATKSSHSVVTWGNDATAELFKDTVVFWSNLNVRETMPYPHLPLSWSYWKEALIGGMIEGMIGIDKQSPLFPYSCVLDLVYGRVSMNLSLLYNYPGVGSVIRFLFPMIDKEAGTVWNALYHRGELRSIAFPRQSFRDTIHSLVEITRYAYRLVRRFRSTNMKNAAQKHWRQAVDFEHIDMSQRSTEALLKAVRERTLKAMLFAMSQAWAVVVAFVGYGVLQWLTRTWPDVPADKLLAGIPGNKTTEGALDLYRLSLMPNSVRETFLQGNLDDLPNRLQVSQEGRNWLMRFDDFLERYGHRGAREMDLAEPRWQENPTFVFQMIRNYLQLTDTDTTPVEHFENMSQERERITALVNERLSQGFWGKFLPWKRELFNTLLKRVQTAMPFRENFKYYLLKVFPGVRRIFTEIGRRLCDAGYLTQAEDVYFLTIPELESWAQGSGADQQTVAQRIAQRKDEWQANRAVNPPCVVRSDGKPVAVMPVTEPGTKILRGVAASSGKITGKAHIILDPADGAAFNKGEILVAPFTDPGWTPLFLTATALVMEVGGMMCHGAVVAREYGIPAIVGVKDALKRIRTGDIITVDGDLGHVVLL